jgi:hypothetical protein
VVENQDQGILRGFFCQQVEVLVAPAEFLMVSPAGHIQFCSATGDPNCDMRLNSAAALPTASFAKGSAV